MELSRLSITNHINENTPVCVLIEIADAHGIGYDQKNINIPNFHRNLLKSINKASVYIVNSKYDSSELTYIARFINKHTKWPRGKLIQAYEYLIQFINNDNLMEKISNDFTTGLQTPENVFSINACILYKICTINRLNVNNRTTIEQMSYSVKLLREDDIGSIMRRAKIFIENSNRINLINILMLSNHEIKDINIPASIDDIKYNILPEGKINHKIISVIHESLHDIKTLQNKINPTTDQGAIALAIIGFNIDISRTVDPINEYNILKICQISNYKPSDPWMKYWFKRNPSMFDLSITFNPLFPKVFYNDKILKELARNEGYTDREITTEGSYELLQLANITETFYCGEYPNLKSNQTCIDLSDVSEVPYGELLCFGQFNYLLNPITIGELVDLFNANKNFTNPFSKDAIFTKTAINKLKLIIRDHIRPCRKKMLSSETIQIRQELLMAINDIENLIASGEMPAKQFLIIYQNSDIKTKQMIVKFLTQLLHMGMYMRGWLGSENYPVSKAIVPYNIKGQVDINVSDSIREYEMTLTSLGKIGERINNLPLVIYRDKEYHASIEEKNGLTIGDRINIVKKGDTVSNVCSCIRLSSNWICASAHKYMTLIGLPPPFDIFNLSSIS